MTRLCHAAWFIGFPVFVYVGVWVVSLMSWSEGPGLNILLLLELPCIAVALWIVQMASARGVVEIGADALVIRHTRVLRRPLAIPRERVAALLLDEGWAGQDARFPTGDPAEPFLWSSRRNGATEPLQWRDLLGRREHRRRPLLGDGVPNLALRLDPPLVLREARDSITAITVGGDPTAPSRRVPAEVVFLSLEDAMAARGALATWPLQDARDRPAPAAAVPEPVRAPPEMAAVLLATTIAAGLLAAAGLLWLTPLPIVVAAPFLFNATRRLHQRATEAVALAGDDPVAQAAVRANRNDAAAARARGSIPPPRP